MSFILKDYYVGRKKGQINMEEHCIHQIHKTERVWRTALKDSVFYEWNWRNKNVLTKKWMNEYLIASTETKNSLNDHNYKLVYMRDVKWRQIEYKTEDTPCYSN